MTRMVYVPCGVPVAGPVCVAVCDEPEPPQPAANPNKEKQAKKAMMNPAPRFLWAPKTKMQGISKPATRIDRAPKIPGIGRPGWLIVAVFVEADVVDMPTSVRAP